MKVALVAKGPSRLSFFSQRDSGELPESCTRAALNFKKVCYTCKEYDEVPNAVRYPIEQVAKKLPVFIRDFALTSTVAYALAFTRYMVVEQMDLYGVDFDDSRHHTQHVSCALIAGYIMGQGTGITVVEDSKFCFRNEPHKYLHYGFSRL